MWTQGCEPGIEWLCGCVCVAVMHAGWVGSESVEGNGI